MSLIRLDFLFNILILILLKLIKQILSIKYLWILENYLFYIYYLDIVNIKYQFSNINYIKIKYNKILFRKLNNVGDESKAISQIKD